MIYTYCRFSLPHMWQQKRLFSSTAHINMCEMGVSRVETSDSKQIFTQWLQKLSPVWSLSSCESLPASKQITAQTEPKCSPADVLIIDELIFSATVQIPVLKLSDTTCHPSLFLQAFTDGDNKLYDFYDSTQCNYHNLSKRRRM